MFKRSRKSRVFVIVIVLYVSIAFGLFSLAGVAPGGSALGTHGLLRGRLRCATDVRKWVEEEVELRRGFLAIGDGRRHPKVSCHLAAAIRECAAS